MKGLVMKNPFHDRRDLFFSKIKICRKKFFDEIRLSLDILIATISAIILNVLHYVLNMRDAKYFDYLSLDFLCIAAIILSLFNQKKKPLNPG